MALPAPLSAGLPGSAMLPGLAWLAVHAAAAETASVDTTTAYPIDASALGVPLHSVGAQSTAGTARLLIDYSEPTRSDILDLLFKPSHGASLQHLKVEIGGDAQISCGAEPSPMRSADPAADDFSRGYEHWLMAEAKRRNPDIVLLGLVYAWPSWINPDNGTSPYASPKTEQVQSILKLMIFIPQVVDFVLKMMGFILKMMDLIERCRLHGSVGRRREAAPCDNVGRRREAAPQPHH